MKKHIFLSLVLLSGGAQIFGADQDEDARYKFYKDIELYDRYLQKNLDPANRSGFKEEQYPTVRTILGMIGQAKDAARRGVLDNNPALIDMAGNLVIDAQRLTPKLGAIGKGEKDRMDRILAIKPKYQ